MSLRRSKPPRRTGRFFLFFLILIFLGAGGTSFFLFFEGTSPTVNLDAIPQHLGKNNTINISVQDTGSGLRFINVTASQKGVSRELYSVTHPRVRQTGQIGPLTDEQSIVFNARKLGFEDGELIITVMASDFSLRGMFSGNSVTESRTVTLDTKPPQLRILHSEKYISPGGTGIAIYTLSDAGGDHGVIINGNFNGGHPVGDGRKDVFIAYFALPYDATSITELKLTASDVAGNNIIVPFTTNLKKVRQTHDRINISDGFLSKKIPEFEQYYPELSGNPVDKYLQANQDIRKENNDRISKLCSNPLQERLWEGRFVRMPGSGRAGFADHRTYYYQGDAIDKQVHLGMDIASTRRADVKAANRGKVVFADYLGIYGHMILLDHGQGVFSLYSHLSQINVAVDDIVATGDPIGLTGTSGMAGGDHLHFSMLINGVFATPIEWWDPHWIEVTINEPLVDSKF